MIRILAIRVIDRIKEAGNTQNVITKHSDLILTRLGFHELNELVCSREGYIVLNLKNDKDAYKLFKADLDVILGIQIKELSLKQKLKKLTPVPESFRLALAAIKIINRHDVVENVQKALTMFGCSIRTRMGVNLGEMSGNEGLILLELTGNSNEINKLAERLSSVENIFSSFVWFE